MSNRKLAFLCSLLVAVIGTSAGAATTTWSGNAGTDYATDGNWSGSAPADNDWADTARFAEVSPANKTPTLGSNRKVNRVLFDASAGWTLDGSGKTLTLRGLSSSGSGTNTIVARIKAVYSGNTWLVGSGNTLSLSGGLYQDTGGSNIIFTGGGTLAISGSIGGWSGSLTMDIDNGTLRVGGATPYSSGGSVYINSADSYLELQTTVSAAQMLIGTKVIDGVGNGLSVTDIGGGYVRITTMAPLDGSWKGSAGTDFEDDANWVGGAPANNDWQDTALFGETSPINRTPALTIHRKVKALDFVDSTGWTLGGGKTLTLRYLVSTGTGTNTITAQLKSIYSNYTWFVGEGNTLTLAGGLYQDTGGSTIILDGGGMLDIPSRIAGWSSSLKMRIEEGTLRIGGSTPYASGGSVTINSEDAVLQLQTTVVAAEALIGSKILDGTGAGLKVSDIGGGFVEIAVARGLLPPSVVGNWVNTLNEEFEGTAINSDLWTPNYIHGQTMGGRLHATVPENIRVSDGKAMIDIKKEDVVVDGTTYHYSSASFHSYGKFHQKYGYFEARIKVPYVAGLWPSFWMMPDRGGIWYNGSISTYNGGMEFDIMEILGQWGAGRYNVACHWDGYDSDHQSWGDSNLTFPSDGQYHIYGMLWKDGEVQFYVDDVLKATWTNARVGWVPAYLILDCEVGGWAGTPDDSGLPAQMEIDWVRAWRDAGDAALANEPTHDTYVRDGDYSGDNMGIYDNMWVKKDSTNYNRQAFLQFDVSNLAGAQEVYLSVVPTTVGSEGSTTTLKFEFVSDDNWTETDTTWSNKPAGSGEVFATQTGGWTVGTPVNIDVTTRALAEAAGDGVLSVRISSTVTGSQKFVVFGSHEETDANYRPVLVVDP